MSEVQYTSEAQGLVKPAQEEQASQEQAPMQDPEGVIAAPQGPGQADVRAQAITQLQRSHGNQYVQRVISRTEAGAQDQEELAESVDARRGMGKPLPDKTRESAEGVFKQDLSGVRVHDDDNADQLSRQFSARAFTTGQDIFFRKGQLDPGSGAGDKLLSHELTHVVQQGNSPTKLAGRKMDVSTPGDAGEREADQVADMMTSPGAVARREESQVQTSDAESLQDDLQRQAAPEEEEPEAVQTQAAPEEEEPEAVQTQAAPEEEEPEAVQTQAAPEEEEPEAVQTQAAPEEEEPEAVQTQAAPEEEEPEAVQTQAAPEEEEPEAVQTQEMPEELEDIQRQEAEEELGDVQRQEVPEEEPV